MNALLQVLTLAKKVLVSTVFTHADSHLCEIQYPISYFFFLSVFYYGFRSASIIFILPVRLILNFLALRPGMVFMK